MLPQNKNKVRQSRLSADTSVARFHFFSFFFLRISANRLRAVFSSSCSANAANSRLKFSWMADSGPPLTAAPTDSPSHPLMIVFGREREA